MTRLYTLLFLLASPSLAREPAAGPSHEHHQAGSQSSPAGLESVPEGRFQLTSLRPGCRLNANFPDYEMHLAVEVVCEAAPARRIRALSDLEGYVAVSDETQALEFVRLFTEGARWTLTAIADYAEVVKGDKTIPAEFVVTKSAFKRCCSVPSVTRVPQSDGRVAFEVTRVVVGRDYHLYRLTELVGPNGEWQLKERRRLPGDGHALGIWIIHNR